MTVTIDIPEEEIKAAVIERVADKLAKNMYNGYSEGYFYRKDIKEAVREIIKADIGNLSDRAVNAAAKSIENKAIKKMIDQMAEND